MKTLRYFSSSKISSLLAIIFYTSFAQPNECLKIGINVNGQPYYGATTVMKDVFKQSSGWSTQSASFTLSQGSPGWQTGLYYAIPTDANGWPNQGMPIPQLITYADNGFNTLIAGTFNGITMTNYTLRELPVTVMGIRLYVYWRGNGVVSFTWRDGTYQIISTVPGTFGTTSVANSYDVSANPGAGVGMTPTWVGGNMAFISNTAGLDDIHYCMLDLSTVPELDRSPNGANNRGIRTQLLASTSTSGNYFRDLKIIYPNLDAGFGSTVNTNNFAGWSNAFVNGSSPEFFRNRPFHPKFLDALRGFSTLRFMAMMGANSVNERYDRAWTQRKTVDYYSYASGHDGKSSVSWPYEIMIQIANEVNANPWFSISAAADEPHKKAFAKLVHDNLNPNLNVYVELGNEMIWNFAPGFNATIVLFNYANINGLDFMTAQCRLEAEAWNAFTDEFGPDSSRVKRVLAGQAVNPYIIDRRSEIHYQNGQNWDYNSITWYFSGADFGSNPAWGTGSTPAQVINNFLIPRVATSRNINDSYANTIWKHGPTTRAFNKKMSLYEGGLSGYDADAGSSPAYYHDNFQLAKFDPAIRTLYNQAIDTVRNYSYVEEILHFIDFGDQFQLSNGVRAPALGYACLPPTMLDTTVAFNCGVTQFGPFTIGAGNYNLCWKELRSNFPSPSVCNPAIQTNSIAAGNALKFSDTRSEYAQVLAATNLSNLSNFTYEFWMKPERNGAMDLVAFSNSGNSSLNVVGINAVGRVYWRINNTAGATLANLTGSQVLPGKWYHIAAVQNGGALSLYVNGTLAVSGSAAGTYNSNRLNLGASRVGAGSPSNFMRGQIDELRVWNGVAVSQADIREFMCKKLNPTHPNFAALSEYYRFDTISGTNLFNSQNNTFVNNAIQNVNTALGIGFYALSGAAIGDQSVYLYPSNWAGVSLAYNNALGDRLMVYNLGAGNPDGVHIYYVGTTPSYNTRPKYYASMSGPYYGVFCANGNDPSYDVSYFYQGNPGASSNPHWNRLVTRQDNSVLSWVHSGARNEPISRSLVLQCKAKYRAEYILGVRQNQVANRPGSGRAMMFNNALQSGVIPYDRPENYTLSFWYYITGDVASGNLLGFRKDRTDCQPQIEIMMSNQGGNDDGSVTYRVNGCGRPHTGTYWNNGGNVGIEGVFNEWNHCAIVRENGSVIIYVNGIPSSNFSIPNDGFPLLKEFTVGGQIGYGGPTNGGVDEISIWNVPFSQAEVRQLMCQKITPAHPKYCNLDLYFNFDEGSGSVLENHLGPGDLEFPYSPIWTISGAALGDRSTYNYNAPNNVSLTHPDGDQVSVALIHRGSRVYGTHLYYVDQAPYYTGPLPSGIQSVDTSRYWGLYVVPSGATKDNQRWNAPLIGYSYGSNRRINSAAVGTYTFLDRRDNSYMNWQLNPSLINNTTTTSITYLHSAMSVVGWDDATEEFIVASTNGYISGDHVVLYAPDGAPTGGDNFLFPGLPFTLSITGPNRVALYGYYAFHDRRTFTNGGSLPQFIVKAYAHHNPLTITSVNTGTETFTVSNMLDFKDKDNVVLGVLNGGVFPGNFDFLNSWAYSFTANVTGANTLQIGNSNGYIANSVGSGPRRIGRMPMLRKHEWILASTTPNGFNFSNSVPTVAGIIGQSTPCQGATQLVYRVQAPIDINAELFEWRGTSGLVLGPSTRDTITVNITGPAGSIQTLSVQGVNTVGKSLVRTLTITVSGTAYLSQNVVGPNILCAGTGGNVFSFASPISPTPLAMVWSVSGGAIITASTVNPTTAPSVTVSVNGANNRVTVSLYATYSCGTSLVNFKNVDVFDTPLTNLQVRGDTICNSDAGPGARIRVFNSEIGVTYYLWNGPTLITTATGNGGTLTLTYPKASLPVWVPQTLTVRAQSGSGAEVCPITPVTLSQPAYVLMGATLSGAQLSPTLLAPSSFCYDWSSGTASLFQLTITGAQPGVVYQAQYQDITIPNGSPLGSPFYYPISNLVTAQTSTVVLNVNPTAFPYWINYVAPTTLTATAQPLGCPTQYLNVRTTLTVNYQAPVVTPTRIAGPGIGLRPPGDDDYRACGAPGSPNTYYTTANGGAPSVFTGRTIVVAAKTEASTWTTFQRSGGTISLADVQDNDVFYLINTSGAASGNPNYPSGGGFNLNSTKLFVRNVNAGAGTFQLSNTRNGTPITWNPGTFSQMTFWAPVTIDQVTSGSNAITIPTRFLTLNGGQTGLRLYSQIIFEQNNTTNYMDNNPTLPNPINYNGSKTFLVCSIAGTANNVIRISMMNPSSFGNTPMPYYAGKGIASWSTASNIMTVFQGDLQNNGGNYMRPGDILRDMNDQVIGIVQSINAFGGNGPRQIILQTNPTFNSAPTGQTFSWSSPVVFSSNGLSLVLRAGTSAEFSGGYNWRVEPASAVTNLASPGGGGTYNAATGRLTAANADPTNNKGGLIVTWHPTFSGQAFITAQARNACGVSQEIVTEPNTPGYNRTRYPVFVNRGQPLPPSAINNANVQICNNPGITNLNVNLASEAEAAGGFQWILRNAGSSLINVSGTHFNNNPCGWSRSPLTTATSGLKEFICCGGPPPNPCLVGEGGNFGGQYGEIPPYPFSGMLEIKPQNSGNLADVDWDQAFTGVANVCVRSYGCGNMLTNMLASPWTCANITIGGIPPMSGTALSGPLTRCGGTGTSNYVGSNPNAGNFNYFVGNALNIGLRAYYRFDGNNQNVSTSPQSAGGVVHLTNGGTYVSDRLGNPNSANQNPGGRSTLSGPLGFTWGSWGLRYRFSIGAWINPADVSGVKMIFGGNENAGMFIANNRLAIYTRNPSGAAIIPANANIGCPGSLSYTFPGGTITAGTWQHVGVTYANENGIATVRAYINGSLIHTVTAPGTPINDGYGPGVSDFIWCGNNFTGILDDIAVYNRDLLPYEMAQLATVTSIPIVSNAGTMNVLNGVMTWSPTFTGIASVGVVPIGCANPGYPLVQTVTVTSFPTITGVQAFNPASCATGASGSVQITVVGFTGANGTLFNVDLNNDLFFEALGTITSGVILVNTGLPSGSVINNVTIRQAGSTCTPPTFPFSFVIGGGVAPSSTPGVSIASSNPACSGSDALVQVSGSQNGVSYIATLNGSVVSTTTVVGTGGNINLTVLGAGLLTATGANQLYNFRVVASSPGCPSVTLGGIGVLTVTGPSVAGTITGSPNPVCAGNNTFLTVSGAVGFIQWLSSTISGSSGFTVITGANSPTYSSPALNTNTWFGVQVTNGSCPTVSVTGAITVTSPVATPSFTYGTSPYCNNASIPAPAGSGTLSGGSFSTTAPGLSAFLNTATGSLAVSAPAGVYQIRYIVAPVGGCPSVVGFNTLTITGLPATPSFTYNNPNCSNVTITTATSANLVGGTFSSTSSGLNLFLNSSNGTIAAPNTLSGTYFVSYSIPASGGCPVVSTTSSVTITPLPATPVFNYGTGPWCNSGPASVTTLSGVTGGSFSATGGLPINAATGNIAPSTLSGVFTVTYLIPASGGCSSVSGSATVTLTGVSSTPSFTYGNSPYCNNSTASIVTSAGISSGYFIGSGALNSVINTLTGDIVASTLSGVFTVTYYKPPVGGCASVSGSNTVTLTGLPATPTISYAAPFCTISANPFPTITNSVAGSVFSASPIGLVFVSTATGQINLSASSQGIYTVTYTIPASGGCPAVVGSVGGVAINSLPGLLFGYTPSNVCTSGTTALTTSGSLLGGGTFSSVPPMGGGLNATTGAVTPASLTPGSYLVSYTVSVPGCGNVTSSAGSALTVTGVASAGAISGPASAICYNTSTILTLVGFAPSGATIQWYNSSVSSSGPWLAVGTSSSILGTGSLTGNNFYIASVNNGICPAVTVASTFTVTVTPQSQSGTVSVVSTLPICQGSNANVQVSGSVGTLQWQSSSNSVSGFTDVSGATSASIATPVLSSDTWFRVVATNGVGCTPAISSPVLVSTTLCGITASFTASGTRFCLNTASTTGITFTDLSTTQSGSTITGRAWFLTGGTPATTLLGVVPSGYPLNVRYLAQGVYNVLLSISGTGGTSSTFAGIITVDGASLAGTVSAAATPICYNTTGNVSISGINSGAFVQWASSTDLVTYTTISGANATSYSAVLTTVTGFRAIVTNGVCPSVTSPAVIVSVSGQALAGTISGPAATLCTGAPFVLDVSGTQSSSTVWYVSDVASFVTRTFAGSGTSISATATLPTAFYRVDVTNGVGCTTVSSATFTVNSSSCGINAVISLSGANRVCANPNALFSFSDASTSSGTLSGWNWNFGSGATPANSTLQNPGNVSYNTPGVRTVSLTVTGTGGVTGVATLVITVDGVAVAGTVSSVSTLPICYNTSANLTLSGSVGVIQWQSSPDNLVWTDISGANSSSYTTGSLTSLTYYRATVTSGVCPVQTTGALTVNVHPEPNTGVLSGPSGVCVGSSQTMQTTGAVGNITWFESSNEVTWIPVGTGATLTKAIPHSPITYYQVRVQSGAGCSTITSTPSLQVSASVCGITPDLTASSATRACQTPFATFTFVDNSSSAGTITGRTFVVSGPVSMTSVLGIVASPQNYTFTTSTPGIYTATLYLSGTAGASATSSGIVFTVDGVSNAGSINTGAVLPLCYNTNITLNVSGFTADNIQWGVSTPGSGFGAAVASGSTYAAPALTTHANYVVTVTNGVCPASISSVFNVPMLSQATVSGFVSNAQTPFQCYGASYVISVNGLVGNVLDWGYSLDLPGGPFTSLTQTNASITRNAAVTGNFEYYQITVRNGSSCAPVVINNPIAIPINGCTANALISTTVPSNLCLTQAQNGLFFTDASTSGGPIQNWFWSFGSGATPAFSTSSFPGIITYATPGTVTVTLNITAAGNVTSSNTYTFTIDDIGNPGTNGVSRTQVCLGSSGGNTITLTASGVTGAIVWNVTTPSNVVQTSPTNPTLGELGTYRFRASATNGTCTVPVFGVAIHSVNVTSQPTASISYATTPMCRTNTQSASLSGYTVSGVFTSSPAGFVNSANGQLQNLTAISAQTNLVVTMSVPGVAGCDAIVTNSNTVTVNIPETVSGLGISGGISEVCNNWTGSVFLTNVTSGATFAVSGGSLLITPIGQINFTGATAGTYQIVQIKGNPANSLDCPAVTSTSVSLTVKNPYVKSSSLPFTYPDAAYCSDGTLNRISPQNVILNPGPGRLVSFANVTAGNSDNIVDNVNGEFIPNAATVSPQVYTIRYRITENNCEPVDELATVGVKPRQLIPDNFRYNVPMLGVCSGTNVELATPIDLSNTTYKYTFTQLSAVPDITVNNNTGAVNVPPFITGATNNTNRVFSVSVQATLSTVGVSGCAPDVETLNFTVTSRIRMPSDTLKYAQPNAFGVYCSDPRAVPISITGYTGGTFSVETFDASGGGSLQLTRSGNINLALSSPGTYRVRYTIDSLNACRADIARSNIFTVTSSLKGSITGTEACEGVEATLINNGLRPGSQVQWQSQRPDGSWVNEGTLQTIGITQSSYITPPVISTTPRNWRTIAQYMGCAPATSDVATIVTRPKPVPAVALGWEYDISTGLTTGGKRQIQLCNRNFTSIKLYQADGVTPYTFVGANITWYRSDDNDTVVYPSAVNRIRHPTNTNRPDSMLTYFEKDEYSSEARYKIYWAEIKNDRCEDFVYSNPVKVYLCRRYDMIPNALAPNSSNPAEAVWDIRGLRLKPNASVQVFNRYGILVYKANGDEVNRKPWDGGGLPAGTYYYHIDDKQANIRTGTVTIIK